MGVTIPTRQDVENSAIAYFQVAHRSPITGLAPPVGPRTFLGQQARALANLIEETLNTAQLVDYDAVPGTYTDEQGVTRTRNSSKALEDWAFVLGLPSNVSGGYGRKIAQAGRNGAATASGTAGVAITALSQLTDPSGEVVAELREAITLSANPVLNGIIIDAVTEGEDGNLPVGTVLRWTSPPPGVTATVTLTTAISGGLDVETDVALALRIVERLQNPPKGGTASDWRVWTESAEDGNVSLVGVVRAYIYPLREGVGSVTIVPTLTGSGADRIPSTTQISQIQDWVDALRIATDTAYVVKPRVVSGEELTIAIKIHAQPGYEFDWDDTGMSATTVSGAHTSGDTTILTNNNPPVDALKDAIDNGDEPRIAISVPGIELPFVTRVLSYSGATLTLEDGIPANLAGGEAIYPAGGATIPVATAILTYVDNVGPSRAGGYAAELDEWEDSVSIGRLAEVALSARDSTSGDRVCVWAPNVGAGTGLTIKVGAGSAAGADFLTYDNVPGAGPQIPEVKAISVRIAS